jgi:hypothetical protein
MSMMNGWEAPRFRLVVANWWGRDMAKEGSTVFRTPTASDPVLAAVVRRLVEAYRPVARARFVGQPILAASRLSAGPYWQR